MKEINRKLVVTESSSDRYVLLSISYRKHMLIFEWLTCRSWPMIAEVVAAAPALHRRLAADRKPGAAGNGWQLVRALPS